MMKKRCISLLLVLAMLISSLPAQVFAQQAAKTQNLSVLSTAATAPIRGEPPFSDVTEGNWFYNAANYVYENGIFSGVSQTEFMPFLGMSRGMFVTTLGKYAGVDPGAYGGGGLFSDVAHSDYYAPYVAWAVEKTITAGVGGGRFDPDSTVTREQMAVFIYNFMLAYNIPMGQDSGKAAPRDEGQISSWAKQAVLALWGMGIFNGDENGNFNPGAVATRAEAAAFYMNLEQVAAAMGIAAEEGTTAPVTGDSTGGGNSGGGNSGGEDPGGEDPGGEDPILYTVTFVTNGGVSIAPVKVEAGETLTSLPTPQKPAYSFQGWYLDEAMTDGNEFTAGTVINSNITLYAKYIPMSLEDLEDAKADEQYRNDTFAASDRPDEYTVTILSSNPTLSADAVRGMIQFESTDNRDSRSPTVTGGGGTYVLSMPGGFTPGGTYCLTLPAEGVLHFSGQEDYVTVHTWSIQKDEVRNLRLNGGISYIPASQISNIIKNGESVSELSVPVYAASNEQPQKTEGTFTYQGSQSLAVGDVLCIYSGANPSFTQGETHLRDSIAYVTVTAKSGSSISYEEADGEQVIALPDMLPISIDDIIETGEYSFRVSADDLDFSEYTSIGLDEYTTIDEGDYIALFPGSSPGTVTDEDDIIYGLVEIVSLSSGIYEVSYDEKTQAEIQLDFDYFTQTRLDTYGLMDDDWEETARQIEGQARRSGFVDSVANQYVLMALESGSLRDLMGDADGLSITMSDGTRVSAAEFDQIMAADNKKKVETGKVKITPTLEEGKEFGSRASRFVLKVEFPVTISLSDGAEIKLEFVVTFIEEVDLSINASGSARWNKFGFIPYIEDYQMNADIDVKTFTKITFTATATLEESEDDNPNKKKKVDITEKIGALMEKLNNSSSMSDNEAKAEVEGIYKLYQDFAEAELNYVEIVRTKLLNVPISLMAGVIQVRITLSFLVKVGAQATVGTSVSYTEGTRYSFWAKLRAMEAGSSSAQILDKVFNFDLYVLGRLGVRAGLELELAVGLISLDLNSAGIIAEAGLYLKLFGFFYYKYSVVNGTPSSRYMGAMYAEFGVYFELWLKMKFVNYVYKPNLVQKEWALLTSNSSPFVYDFAYEVGPEEKYIINDTHNLLPSYLGSMIELDLVTGAINTPTKPLSNLNIRFTNPAFSVQNGRIVVNSEEEYLTTNMEVTWGSTKLTMTSQPIQRIFRVIYTDSEDLVERHMVSVKLNGNVVWKGLVPKGKTLAEALPSREEILALVHYDSFNETFAGGAVVNLKYDISGGYGYVGNMSNRVEGEMEVSFNLPLREYTLPVERVENTNGTLRTNLYTAEYGSAFNLQDLHATGSVVPQAGTDPTDAKYTKFVNVLPFAQGASTPSETAIRPTGAIDMAFAKQLWEGAHTYNAQYRDNSVTITYDFVTKGVNTIPRVQYKIEKFASPDFDYTSHVEGFYTHEDEAQLVFSVNGTFGPADQNRSIQVTHIPQKGYEIILHLMGGSYTAAGYRPPEGYDPVATLVTPLILPTADQMVNGTKRFVGWYANSDFSGEPVTQISGDMGKVILYASWITEYRVAFDKNGGDDEAYGTMEPTVPVPIEQTTILPVSTFVKYDYVELVFTGWNTMPDGTGTDYTVGQLISNPAEVNGQGVLVLYAQWEDTTNVIYQKTDGFTPWHDTDVQSEMEMPFSAAMHRAAEEHGLESYAIKLTEHLEIAQAIDLSCISLFDGAGYTISSNYVGVLPDGTVNTAEQPAQYAETIFTWTDESNATYRGIENITIIGGTGPAIVWDGMLFLTDATIQQAADGALRNSAEAYDSENPSRLRRVLIQNCRAENGGAIYNINRSMALFDCTIIDCVAEQDGGAIYGPTVLLSNTVIANNSAGGYGGAVCNANPILVNSSITGNYSRQGGAIHLEDTGSLEAANSVIAGNYEKIAEGEYRFNNLTAEDELGAPYICYSIIGDTDLTLLEPDSIYRLNDADVFRGSLAQDGSFRAQVDTGYTIPTVLLSDGLPVQSCFTDTYTHFEQGYGIYGRVYYGPTPTGIMRELRSPQYGTMSSTEKYDINGIERTVQNNKIGASTR